MNRYLVWLRWEVTSHWIFVAGCVAAAPLAILTALLLGRSEVSRAALEAVELGVFALIGIVLGAGLFASERRGGAASLVLRTPRARLPLFLARLTFLAGALIVVALALAMSAAQLFRHHMPTPSGIGHTPWFFWPRWVLGDIGVLALALIAVALLASAWTKRPTLAVVIAIFLPLALLLPLVYLSATRSDFYDVTRLGAVPLFAWPLFGVALIALALSWFRGRHYLNHPGRALGLGLLVLLGAALGAAGFTARAFALFDEVSPDHPGFRLAAWPIPGKQVRDWQADTTALSIGGRFLYVHGYRQDAGHWPVVGSRSSAKDYGPFARDFRADRGAWSRIWRIDLESGTAVPLGAVRSFLDWRDVGGPRYPFLLGVDLQARLAPKRTALLRVPGHGDEARLLDLVEGTVMGSPIGSWTGAELTASASALMADGSGVLDAQGRVAQLNSNGEFLEPGAHVVVETTAGQRPVDVQPFSPHVSRRSQWLPIPGGWAFSLYSRVPRVATIDATTGVMRVLDTANPTLRAALALSRTQVYLGPTAVLLGEGPIEDATDVWRYRVLDLETTELSEPRRGTDWSRVLQPALPDGRLLCLDMDPSPRFVLWNPVTDVRTPVKTPPGVIADGRPLLRVIGADSADRRGNRVLTWLRKSPDPGKGIMPPTRSQPLLFRASTQEIVPLHAPGGLRIHVVAIDARDRVVALSGLQLRFGFTTVVRFDPATGKSEQLFPH